MHPETCPAATDKIYRVKHPDKERPQRTPSEMKSERMEGFRARLRPIPQMAAPEQSSDRGREIQNLMQAAIDGDSAAYREIVLQFDSGLRALAFRLLQNRDRMDDVLQEVYLKAFRSLAGFRKEARLGTWLYRITYNACIDELRRAGKQEWVEFDDQSHGEVGSDPIGDITDRLLVDEALSRLSPGHRAALVLVDGQGFDYRAAGEVLGVAEGTVASRLHRARQAMHQLLSEGIQQ